MSVWGERERERVVERLIDRKESERERERRGGGQGSGRRSEEEGGREGEEWIKAFSTTDSSSETACFYLTDSSSACFLFFSPVFSLTTMFYWAQSDTRRHLHLRHQIYLLGLMTISL